MPALELLVKADVSQLDTLRTAIQGMTNDVGKFAKEMRLAMSGTVQEGVEDAKAHAVVVEKLNAEIKRLQQQQEASALEHTNRLEALQAAHAKRMEAIANGEADALGRIRKKASADARNEASEANAEAEAAAANTHRIMLNTGEMNGRLIMRQHAEAEREATRHNKFITDMQVRMSKQKVKAQEEAAAAAKRLRDQEIADDTRHTYTLLNGRGQFGKSTIKNASGNEYGAELAVQDKAWEDHARALLKARDAEVALDQAEAIRLRKSPYSAATRKRAGGNEYGAELADEDKLWADHEAALHARLQAEIEWERATKAQWQAQQDKQLQAQLSAELKQKEQFYKAQEAQEDAHQENMARKRRIAGLDQTYLESSPADRLRLSRRARVASLKGDDAEAQFGSYATNFGANKSISELDGALKQLTETRKNASPKTREAINLEKELSGAYVDVKHAMRGLEYAGGVGFLSYGNMVPLAGAFALSAAFKEALTTGTEFQHQMAMIGAVSDQTSAQMLQLGGNIRQMGHDSLYGPTDIAKGVKNLAQAGLSTADSLKALPPILNMATLGEMDMAHAADIATGIMFAFNLQASDMGRITDVLSKVASDTKLDVGQLGESVKIASTVAGKYNVTLEQTAAALGVLAQRNIVGTRAGTEFKDMMEHLVPTSKKVHDVLDKMHLSFFDKAGNPKELTQFLDEVHAKVQTLDKESQAGFFKTVFGQQGGTAAYHIIANLDEYKADLKDAQTATGYLDRAVQQLKDGVGAQMKMAWNEFQLDAIGAFQAAEPALQEFVHALQGMAKSQDFKDFLTSVVTGIANLSTWLVRNGATVWDAVKAYAALKAGMMAFTAVSTLPILLKNIDLAIATATERQIALQAAAEGAAGAEATCGARMAALANPLGIIAGALVTIGVLEMEFGDKALTAADKQANATEQNLTNIQREINKYRERELAAKGTLESTEAGARIKLALDGAATARKESEKAHAEEKEFGSQHGLPRLLNSIAGAGPDMGRTSLDDSVASSHADAQSRSALADAALARANGNVQKTIQDEAQLEMQREAAVKAESDQAKRESDKLKSGAVHIDFNPDKTGASKQYSADLGQDNSDYRDQIQAAQTHAQAQRQVIEAEHQAGILDKTDYLKQLHTIQKTADDAEDAALQKHYNDLAAMAARSDAAQRTRLQTNAMHAKAELDRFREQRASKETADLAKSFGEYLNPVKKASDSIDKDHVNLADHTARLNADIKLPKDKDLEALNAAIAKARTEGEKFMAAHKGAEADKARTALDKQVGESQGKADQRRKELQDDFMAQQNYDTRLFVLKQQHADSEIGMTELQKKLADSNFQIELQYRDRINDWDRQISDELAAQNRAKAQGLAYDDRHLHNLQAQKAALMGNMHQQQASTGAAITVSDTKDRSAQTGFKNWYKDFQDQAGNTASQIQGLMTTAFGASTKALQQFVMYGKADIKSLERQVLQSLMNIAIQKAELGIVTSLVGAFSGGTQGAFMGGMFGGPSVGAGLTSAPVTSLTGSLISAGTKHSGGLVGLSDNPSRHVSMGLFGGAPRFHTGGIAGDEVPIIAKRGEGIFTPQQMASLAPVASGGGSGQNVININIAQQSDGSSTSDVSGGNDKNVKQFASEISGMVDQRLVYHSKPGGLLYNQRKQGR